MELGEQKATLRVVHVRTQVCVCVCVPPPCMHWGSLKYSRGETGHADSRLVAGADRYCN